MHKLYFMSNQTILYISIHEIVFLKWMNRKLYLYTKNEVYQIEGNIKKYEYLKQYNFIKMNRSTIINYNVITYLDKPID